MLSERQILFLLLALAVTGLLYPHIVRSRHFQNFPAGDEPYKDALSADHLSEGDYRGLNPFTLLLSLFGNDSLTFLNVAPLILGILSIAATYLLLRELNAQGRLLFLFMWILSPLFIYAFNQSGTISLFITLLTIGLVLFVKGSRSSLIFLIPAALFGVGSTAITALAIYSVARYRNRLFWTCMMAVCIAGILFNGILLMIYGLPLQSDESSLSLQDTITAFGALRGFSIFALLLCGIGLIKTWQEKNRNAWYFAYFGAIVIIAILNPEYRTILNIAVSYLAAIGFIALVRRSWEAALIRNLTIILLLFGMLFNTVTYIGFIANMAPDPGTVETLSILRNEEDAGVLSHYKNAYWIEYIGGKAAYLDGTDIDKEKEAGTIFVSRDESLIGGFLEENGIRYVFVDMDTRTLMRDESNYIGLEFIMQNSPRFRKLSDVGNYSLWRYNPDNIG
jgi:hypothetical protein